MKKEKLGILMGLMVLFAAAGGVAAQPYTSGFNGDSTSTADQTNVSKVHVGTNGTVEVTFPTNRTISDGGSVVFEANVTPQNASFDGSSDLNLTINDGNVTISDTNTSDAASESLNTLVAVFPYNDTGNSSGTVVDYINTTVATNQTVLMQDADATEVQYYEVVETSEYLANDAPSTDNGHFNTTTGEYIPNKTGVNTTFVFDDITRENTTYKNRSVENLTLKIGFAKQYFSNIDDGDEIRLSEGLQLKDVRDTGEDNQTKTFVIAVKNESNVTSDYFVKVNATPESVDANSSVVYTEQVNPKGGPTGEAQSSYALNAATGGAPLFAKSLIGGNLILLVAALGVLAVVGFVFWNLRKNKDSTKSLRGYSAYTGWIPTTGWGLLLLTGVGLTLMGILGASGIAYTTVGLPITLAGVVGGVSALILNNRNSVSTR